MDTRDARHRAALLLLGLTLLLGTVTANACVCEPMTPEEGLEQAAYVFVGTVIREETPSVPRTFTPEGRQVVTADWTRWDFLVSRAWKGAPPETVAVYTCLTLSCGLKFDVGMELLVYGYASEDQRGSYSNWPKGTRFPVIVTGSCTRTRLLERAAEDLSSLGEPTWHRVLPIGPPSPSNRGR